MKEAKEKGRPVFSGALINNQGAGAEGQGATFWLARGLSLPEYPQVAPPTFEPYRKGFAARVALKVFASSVSTTSKTSLRVLVVDDEPLVGESLKEILEFGGHTAESVLGAKEALDLFKPGAFDLLIIDYVMPVMKGDELAAAIRARAPNQRIIIVTGLAGKLQSGVCADLILSKPFQLRDFLAAIDGLFE